MRITIISDEISESLSDVVYFCKKNKLNYIELRTISGKNLLNFSINEIRKIKKILDKNNLKVSALASPLFKWFHNKNLSKKRQFDSFFFNPNLNNSDKKRYILKAIEIAKILETKYIRIFSNLLDNESKNKDFFKDALLWFALEEAKKKNLYLLLENEPACWVHKKKDIVRLTEKITHPNFGILLDIANLYQIGESIGDEEFKKLKKNIKYFHLKDFNEFSKYVILGSGKINYKRIFSDIKNYFLESTFLSIETHVAKEKIASSQKSIKFLKENVNKKRVRYALIGAGRISDRHFNAIKETGNAEARAVLDIVKSKTKTAASLYDLKSYISLEHLLKDKSIDVVTVCTPHDTHLELVKKIVKNNKIALCEKPLAIDSKSLNQALKVKNFNNKVFVVLQNNFNPAIRYLFSLTSQNKLGEIISFSLSLRWWRNNSYYNGWHGKKKRSGGTLFTQAIHSIGVLNKIVSLDIKKVQSIRKKINNKSDFEDIFLGVVELKNGVIGNIEVNLSSRFRDVESSLFITGAKGSIKIDGVALNRITHLSLDKDTNINNVSHVVDNVYGSGHKSLIKCLSAFLLLGKDPDSKLLVKPIELKKTISFIEDLYAS